jgi:hypothetical protein
MKTKRREFLKNAGLASVLAITGTTRGKARV